MHPPLYYCAVLTAESLFPGLGLPWAGLLPNFVFLLAGTVVLYFGARRLTGQFWVAWLAAAVFLGNIGTQGMAVFTRMYAMLMAETVVLAVLHLRLFRTLQAGQRPRWVFLGLALATLAGALTQYFFLVFCFFFCGLFGLWLLCTRRWKTALLYAVAGVRRAGGGVSGLPHHERAHLFGVPGGQQAFGSFLDLSPCRTGRPVWGGSSPCWGGQFGGAGLWTLLLLLAAAILWKAGCRPRGMGLFAGMLALAGILYIVVIDKVAPFEADRYYVLVYGPLILAGAAVVARLAALYPRWEPLLAILVVVPVLAAHLTQGNGSIRISIPLPWKRPRPCRRWCSMPPDTRWRPICSCRSLPSGKRCTDRASGTDDAASLADAVQSRDLSEGFLLYGYIYDADELLDLAQQVLDIRSARTAHRCGPLPCLLY